MPKQELASLHPQLGDYSQNLQQRMTEALARLANLGLGAQVELVTDTQPHEVEFQGILPLTEITITDLQGGNVSGNPLTGETLPAYVMLPISGTRVTLGVGSKAFLIKK